VLGFSFRGEDEEREGVNGQREESRVEGSKDVPAGSPTLDSRPPEPCCAVCSSSAPCALVGMCSVCLSFDILAVSCFSDVEKIDGWIDGCSCRLVVGQVALCQVKAKTFPSASLMYVAAVTDQAFSAVVRPLLRRRRDVSAGGT
jgi:hypothetical protein